MADIHWQCQLYHIGVDKDQATSLFGSSDQLTVGEQFVFKCEGPEVAAIDVTSVNLELPKDQQYALKILKNLGIDSHKASFIATSYLVNPQGHQFPNLFLSDGKSRVALDSMPIKVKSVITKENNPKNEPFPPWGPFGFHYPLWTWLSFTVVALLVFSFVFEKVLTTRKRKKFLRLLEQNPAVLSPFHQYTKELRHLSRELPHNQNLDSVQAVKYLSDMNKSLRWYLSRMFQFACFEETASQILKNLKAKDPERFKKIQTSLTLALVEVERWQNRPSQLKIDDAIQLIEILRTAGENVQRTLGGETNVKLSRARLDAEV